MREAGVAPGITVDAVGGLGNQLFIYATGVARSVALGCPLYLDTSWFSTSPDRAFALDQFEHAGSLVGGSPESRAAHAIRGIRRRLGVGGGPGLFEEGSFGYDPAILDVRPGTRLSGYFQSWRYFGDVADEVRSQVRSIRSPSPWFMEMSSQLAGVSTCVAFHVRRGDYTRPDIAAYHGLLGEQYYRRAAAQMEQLLGPFTVVVFSDEPWAATEVLRGLDLEVLVIEPPAGTADVESLVLMSQAQGVVMANSSFSWWGAWLGDAPGRPVIAPRPWFEAAVKSTDDLLPPHWLTLGK